MKISFSEVLVMGLACLCGYACNEAVCQKKRANKSDELLNKSIKQTEEAIKLAKDYKNMNKSNK